MLTSEPCIDVLTALCAARLDFPTITRNREGFSKRGGQKYQYADLNAIIDATEPVLGAHGLLLVQSVEDGEGDTLRITSTLYHASSGQWLSSHVSVEKPDDLQNFGMACTYLKRYAQQALLNISTEDDPDGVSVGASKPEKSAAAEKYRPTEPVNGNGHTPAPEPIGAHPTLKQIEGLFDLALRTCGEDEDVMSTRIRQTMNLPANASTSKRLLAKTMSGEQFDRLRTYYQTLLAQLQRQTEVVNAKAKVKEATHGTEPASQESAAAQPAPATAVEVPAVDPPPASAAASSSAPEASAEPIDTVETLVADAISWGLKEDVTRRVITLHKDLAKCRRILGDAAERNKRQVA